MAAIRSDCGDASTVVVVGVRIVVRVGVGGTREGSGGPFLGGG